MAEIYSSLSSPNPDPRLPFTNTILGNNIRGLRSVLHPYQMESVIALVTKESASPQDYPNPLYIPITGLDGTVFYFQPTTFEVLAEQEQILVQPAKGGILCEELGE